MKIVILIVLGAALLFSLGNALINVYQWAFADADWKPIIFWAIATLVLWVATAIDVFWMFMRKGMR